MSFLKICTFIYISMKILAKNNNKLIVYNLYYTLKYYVINLQSQEKRL